MSIISYDLHQRAVTGAMERKSPDTGDIFPGMAFMERCNQTKPLGTVGPEKGEGNNNRKGMSF